MEEKYTYEITENGYYILNEGKRWIHQYEPYIPNKNLSYEENAKAQIKELIEQDYLQKVIIEEIKLEDVPEEYKEDVTILYKQYEENKMKEPASRQEVTEVELALAEVYEMILGGN